MALRIRTRFPVVIVGALSVALGLVVLLIWYVNGPVAARGGRDLSNFWIIAAWLLISGAGTLCGSRVAALGLALPFAVYGGWWLAAAAVGGHIGSAVAALVAAVLYLAPLVISIAGWHLLGWSKWRSVV